MKDDNDSKALNISRTADKDIYLRENRFEKPKEIFVTLGDLIEQAGLLARGGTACDFGCAAGEFLYYLRNRFPGATLIGSDIVPELLEKATRRVPGVSFEMGSVLDAGLVPDHSVDVSCLMGVLQIFDECEPCLDNLLRWTRPGGRIYIFGLVNPHPIDVWVKYRVADSPDGYHREAGWNSYSRLTLSRYLESKLGPDRCRFVPFEMPFDLPPNLEDYARTWTIKTAEGRRLFVNGLSMICNLEILEIRP